MIYLFIGLGGILGSLLRYLLANIVGDLWNTGFPLGTLFINLTGTFFLGWFSSVFIETKKLSPNVRAAITTGVIGSYTTFSTFCLETVKLMNNNEYFSFILYIFASLFGGLLFAQLGIKSGKKVNVKRGDQND